MKIAKVTGSVVSTKKEEGLVGSKLMIVRFESSDGVPYGNEEVAVDYVGAGMGKSSSSPVVPPRGRRKRRNSNPSTWPSSAS